MLRLSSSFTFTMTGGLKLTCAEAAKRVLKRGRQWDVRSADSGPKGERWYAWAWLGTASPRHCLPVRRHLKTGEMLFPQLTKGPARTWGETGST